VLFNACIYKGVIYLTMVSPAPSPVLWSDRTCCSTCFQTACLYCCVAILQDICCVREGSAASACWCHMSGLRDARQTFGSPNVPNGCYALADRFRSLIDVWSVSGQHASDSKNVRQTHESKILSNVCHMWANHSFQFVFQVYLERYPWHEFGWSAVWP